MAEYARNGYQDYVGFKPDLPANTLAFTPAIPSDWTSFYAVLPFGSGDSVEVDFKRLRSAGHWDFKLNGATPRAVSFSFLNPDKSRSQLAFTLAPGKPATLVVGARKATLDGRALAVRPAQPSFAGVIGKLGISHTGAVRPRALSDAPVEGCPQGHRRARRIPLMDRMKNTFLLAALLSGAAIGADNGPLPKDLYVRGAFNGWGTDNVLAYKGKGVYETQIVISPGNHAFKVGYKDWSAEWVIDPAASVSVATGTDYKMDTHPGPEDYLFVKQTGAYRFSIDVSTPSAPVLRVVRVAAAPVAAIDPHKDHQPAVSVAYPTFDGKQEIARFSVKDAGAPLREYAQSSTMQLRDPGPQFVTYQESAGLPTVRSGNLAFDALFALAGAEMKLDSVAEIKDGNYNGGAAIACDCFETGEKWHYVWTRDLSYAADLGLAMLDPLRVMHSLDFKLSGYRPGVVKPAQVAGTADGLQIIQDTGSGGSWPVSTDRVTWAFGAEEVLKTLPASGAQGVRRACAAGARQHDRERPAGRIRHRSTGSTRASNRSSTGATRATRRGSPATSRRWRRRRRCRPTSATTRR